MKNNCIYFAEGRCEERLLNALKESPHKIKPGRVKVFNVIQELLPKSQLIMIQAGTTVVLVFDTDVPNTEYLRENIKLLTTLCTRVKIVYLPQVRNFEDELVRCSDIKSVVELTRSRSNKDFKRDFCVMSNVRSALEKVNLKVERMWVENPPQEFSFISKNGNEVKL